MNFLTSLGLGRQPLSLGMAFALTATCWYGVGNSHAANLAPEGAAIIGVKDAVDTAAGTPRSHNGVETSINDDFPHSTRVDNWFGVDPRGVSYVGVLWASPRSEFIKHLKLTFATFTDGGWFGLNGLSPAPGEGLTPIHLVEPSIQVTTDAGISWTTIAHSSNYLSRFNDHRIGGGANSNPSLKAATFTLDTPQTGIDGIRVIGENGGLAGVDANGFLGVFELEVHTGPAPVSIGVEGTGIIGVNDAIDGDAGTARSNAGVANNLNDGALHTRVDTWYSGNTDQVSFVGIL